MSVRWYALSKQVWVFQEEGAPQVSFSAVVYRDGKFMLMNAGMLAGSFKSLERAQEAAEDYWASQEVGPLADVGKASAVSTGLGEAIAQPVPVTGTSQAIVGGVERQHRSRLKR